MPLSIAGSNRVAPPAFTDVSSAAQPVGRMATAVKNCANVPVRPPHAEKPIGMFCKALHMLGFKSGENSTKSTSLDSVDGPSSEGASSGQSTGRMASGLKRSANVSERPIHIERRDHHGVLCKAMHALGLKSNEVPRKEMSVGAPFKNTQPVSEVRRQEVRSALEKELEKCNFEQLFKDPVTREQGFQMMYGAIFGRAKDSLARTCVELNASRSDKRECSVKFGSIAKEFGMDGQEENGVFCPSCIGANGYVTMVLTPVESIYGLEFSSERSEFSRYAEGLVAEKMRSIAMAWNKPDPEKFAISLQNAVIEHIPDYD